jgi:hypothetical protein
MIAAMFNGYTPFHISNILIHIVAGILAIGCGTVAIVSAKGKQVHVNAGRLFTAAQLAREAAAAKPSPIPPAPGRGAEPSPIPLPANPESTKITLRRFHGAVRIDATRLSRDVDQIAGAIVQHLGGLLDAKLTITLEIDAEIPSGAPDNIVRTVTENCRTLEFDNSGFEEN